MTDREIIAVHMVKSQAKLAAAAGALPVPILDFVALTGLQYVLVHQLATYYQVPFYGNRARALIGALTGSAVSRGAGWAVLGSVARAIPGVGWLAGWAAMSALSAASTYAIGKVFIQHFESGGTLLDFDPDRLRDYYRRHFYDESARSGGSGKPE
ncbi:MAG: DUF697 domain-containing protein [Betaproteobacteria bacterium]|nr:DUF697 domain-containing protein [Betaproteobacteria bacterium]